MTRLDLLAALGRPDRAGRRIGPLGNRQMRWLLEKTLGIAQGRKLPRVTSRSFLRRAARRRLTRPSRRSGQKVLYFVDVYANYFDPQLAEAMVAVLEHNGIAVLRPPGSEAGGHAVDRLRRRWNMPGSWPNITSRFWPNRCARATTWWPPSRPPRSCLTHEYPAVARRRRRPAGGR